MFSSNTSQVADDKLFVEDCFSTYLYQGNGSTQTITNGIDLAGKGGMVWIKNRAVAQNHFIQSTQTSGVLSSNTTSALSTPADFVANSNGFTSSWGTTNGNTYASWTFRKAPKFFDVVTYTGSSTNIDIPHSLGVEPGCIVVKRVDSTSDWFVYHRGNGTTVPYGLSLNLSNAAANPTGSPTAFINSSTFRTSFIRDASSNAPQVDGATYVAYLFAHDTTSDGIIQCGSFNVVSSAATVNLGWEPQWLLIKKTDTTGPWILSDTMRGYSQTTNQVLFPNGSDAEAAYGTIGGGVTATGFNFNGFYSSGSFIYIAIRRGPMRTPTSGTSVFSPQTSSASAGTYITTGFPVDFQWMANRDLTENKFEVDRLRGFNSPGAGTAVWLSTNLTNAEASNSNFSNAWDNTGFKVPSFGGGINSVYLSFRRAPSFFDEVCYTGTGVARTINHNLGVAPELMIVKSRVGMNSAWRVYAAPLGATQALRLETTGAATSATIGGEPMWNNTAPTSTVFSLGTSAEVNNSGVTWVAYLFASCPGVSKVFSFTGNGSSQTINCGFSGGARFILIKRTDSTGNWVVFDSARGIVSGNDPSLLLNSTAAETNYDDIDPDSSGFIVNQSTNNLNVNGASYIGLAVA